MTDQLAGWLQFVSSCTMGKDPTESATHGIYINGPLESGSCEEKAPNLVEQASALQVKYSRLLTSFGKCHRGYNTMKVFTEAEIDELGKCNI